MRILTGVQPSGKLHLGNYFSVIRKLVAYQDKTDLFCFVADLHALTTFTSAKNQTENTYDAVCDFLALGIDPDKSTFWIQSEVPEVTELTWYLSMSITVPKLELAHSYKDKVAKGITPSGGLFFYPVLMAADILAFDSDRVPVGKDQKQHLEYARDIAEKFNAQYGETFKLPDPEIDEETAIVPGVDGAKMSKSYGNTINFFDDEKKLKKSVMGIVTDSAGVDEAKDYEKSVIYAIHSLFLDTEERKALQNRFSTPGTGYGDLKKALLENILDYFGPYRKEREKIAADPTYVKAVMKKGSDKARNTASAILGKVRDRMGIGISRLG
ncbi:tryptophan--tRNA ligase [Leptospira wolffii]|uniref:Tryptophan--tRNA ligase n=1 Tax=Leptospira wolffii TaxID=409998 RepID=A0A2M9ZDR4_9LEPT|nr:tryptophan--tRNA ligase [Leptospira wolffii]PJZ66556.1 tryptophan--tRNA ligase [Leptospira wolffii]TGK61537.1 tryptophan--tRNA ligase [Leptospira wolffii]TGK70081.1 tryptophan--tRNA ligase [Leptospira wolffii]TGK77004.1 tryptophan--tRNA ligase [Leptospira wolffii]TGL31144.1 tryptophan--tRNA ligase [Leptospira wolffii]